VLFALTTYGAYVLLFVNWVFGPLTAWVMLPWLTVPVGAGIVREVRNRVDGPSLNRALAQTGMLQLAFCMLLAAGVLISR
jgi:1,4-dihydroxy-2-naphthoate octaprenyltransferase